MGRHFLVKKVFGIFYESHKIIILIIDFFFDSSYSNLPIVVKGILSVEDAILAVKYGANAIQISNHGMWIKLWTLIMECGHYPQYVHNMCNSTAKIRVSDVPLP